MHTRPVRFGSQWALVGVIFFYAVGTVIIARHMEIIDTPKPASGNEFEMPEYLSDSSALTRVHTKVKCVETVLKKADIEPYHINGQIKGLRITGLDRISASKDLLIKNGDIISAVDGHSLRSKRQAYGIFKRARTKPGMIVELLRDGKAKILLFNFH
jgi:S1-C subfamily serine protease